MKQAGGFCFENISDVYFFHISAFKIKLILKNHSTAFFTITKICINSLLSKNYKVNSVLGMLVVG